jgi:hypothetical protein
MNRSPPATRPDYREERRRIMARVSHLLPRKQQDVERAVRILRACFIDCRPRAPKRGTLCQIMLVGPSARPGDQPDTETWHITDYEFWAFVDHPAYKGMNRYWGRAREVLAQELCGRATITLSVFTAGEMDRIRAAGNRFLTDKYDGGVVLFDITDAGSREASHDLD